METKLKVSVVINVYNEEDNIEDSLDSLKEQTFSDFELIIVDDGSTDDTMNLVKRYRNIFDLKTCKTPHVGPRKARSEGISKSSGDVIVTVDGDEILKEDYLENILEPYKYHEVGSVGGVLKSKGSGWASEAYGALNEIFYEFRGKGEEIDWIHAGCSSIRREAYEDVGGISTRKTSGDKDISWKLQKKGWRVILKKDAIAIHKDPTTLSSLMSREYNIGKREYLLLKSHRDKVGWKELSRFYPLLGLISLLFVPIFLPLLVLIGSGFLATFVITIYIVNSKLEKTHFGISLKCWLVLTAINLAWSLGLLKGIFSR